jgi:hypothetical protein
MKQALAYIVAGAATWLTVIKFQHWASAALLRTGVIRTIASLVFFGVLLILGRWAFQDNDGNETPPAPSQEDFKQKGTPQETSDQMARIFGGVTDEASRSRAIRNCLYAVPQISVLIPFIFYLRFGRVGPLGWGATVFFDVYSLLWAIALYFRPRTKYHTRVQLRGDWVDRIAAFWLVGCAFGPLLGWTVTEAFPITQKSWPWLYGLRVFLAAILPILLALPLLRYIRGKATAVALPLLVVITFLPVSTAMQVSLDLWEGPVLISGESELYLKHTERSLGSILETN